MKTILACTYTHVYTLPFIYFNLNKENDFDSILTSTIVETRVVYVL